MAQAAALRIAKIMFAFSCVYFAAWSAGNWLAGLPAGTLSILDRPPAHADLEQKFPGLHDTGGIRFEKIQDRHVTTSWSTTPLLLVPSERIENSFDDLKLER